MGTHDSRLDEQILKLKKLSNEIKVIDIVTGTHAKQIGVISEMLWVINKMQVPELMAKGN